jgi:DNA primase
MRLGVCVSGRFQGRVIFPVFDHADRLIFYQGRATWKEHPRERRHIKTLSPRLDEGCAGPGDCLLNLSYVQQTGLRRVLVVEGPIDCAHAWPDAVATFGKKISARQIELLVRAGIREIDLCWDADAVAEMQELAPGLADVFSVRVVQLPPGTDPGDLTKEEIEQYRAQAATWGTGERLMRL